MATDKTFLEEAVAIAGKGIEKGNGPFGAVITLDGKIISRAVNRVVLAGDPTAHAEVLAIRKAAKKLGTHSLDGCVLYASCEPCPMCLGAIYWAGIKRVVYAASRKDAARAGFSDDFIYSEIALDPSKRQVTFTTMSDAGGSEVFRIWDDFEGKIAY